MTEALSNDWRCAACGETSSYQGHTMKDMETDEFFFSCVEPERARKIRDEWMKAWQK